MIDLQDHFQGSRVKFLMSALRLLPGTKPEGLRRPTKREWLFEILKITNA